MSADTMKNLYDVIEYRKSNPKEDSYTCYLFERGLDKILGTIGSESSETIVAAKNGARTALIYEISDLLYHLTVLMVEQGIELETIMAELERRAKTIADLK